MSNPAIEPRINMVLIKPKKLDDKRGSILIPTSALERDQAAVTEGEIIAIGPDAWTDYPNDMGAEIGDWVVYAQYAGFAVQDAESREKYVLINDQDVKATLARSVENDG